MKVRCRDLGPMDYAACWELQRTLFEELLAEKNRRRNGCGAKESGPAADKTDTRPDDAGTVLLVEHPPVYTLGKSGHAENLLVGRTALEQLGAQFFHIDRGGDITFHGPGQLVCYPILDLERLGIGLREYIGRLEETVIRVVAHYGIAAGRIDGASGVWLGGAAEQRNAETERNAEDTDGRNAAEKNVAEEQTSEKSAKEERSAGKSIEETVRIKRDAPRKICAIGVRSSRYVTMHGFALNVDTDLEWFSRINPCGFSDRGVTSMARETRREVAMEEVKRLVLEELGEQLGVEIRI
ncbi:lipoyl(octanoyl) transferase LipB [Alistipes sp. UBA6068]|uniref:lipoyl(octanoyl) transferase LipB n=1 Tax=Alistipes sp. UBA6068 TaxID=1946012 RepID=UPI00259A535C|nr:lipoyl(octanoyl) transferase LipB [Alistipes sp. UBA6068]